MFKSFVTVVLAATALAFNPPSQEERDSVKELDETMKHFGRDYELHRVKTQDGWELTLFRLIPSINVGEVTHDEKRRSVLVGHGSGMDGTNWFSWFAADPSFDGKDHVLFNLADEGYDVWIASNRGTKYSNNPKYPDADDPTSPAYLQQNKAKYDYSWFEMGQYDVPAFLEKITDVTGNEKVTYVGYSQGTSQMIYGLASHAEGLDKLDKAVLLAPCLYIVFGDIKTYNNSFPVLRESGVNHFGGPSGPATYERVCEAVDDATKAKRATACGFLKLMAPYEAQAVKGEEQYGQIAVTGRFQEYIEDFSEANQDGKSVSPGLGSIDVPIQILQAAKDEFCPVSATRRLMGEIGDAVWSYKEVSDPEATHEYFLSAMANPDFLPVLRDEIDYQKLSQADAVQWAIGNFVEEKDREEVERKVDNFQDAVDDAEEAVEGATEALEDFRDSVQGLADAVNELFMQDYAFAFQASSTVMAAAYAVMSIC